MKIHALAELRSWALALGSSGLLCCAASPAQVAPAVASPAPSPSTPASSSAVPEHAPHHHERAYPATGPDVSVVFGDQRVAITLADLAHGASSVALVDLWKAALPDRDPEPLRFDLFGSDGFHPSDRPPCAAPLTIELIRAAHLDVKSHDLTFDAGHDLPGCYHVHAVVRFEGRAAPP